jgi:hypothetical protein
MIIQKTILISIILSLFSSVSHAQDKNSNFFAEAFAGPSIPVGKFGSKEHTDFSAGLASPGFTAGVSFGYTVSGNLSIVLLAGGSQNKMDKEAFEKRINQSAMPGTYSKVSTDDWKIGKLMLGGEYQWQQKRPQRISFTSKILGGIVKTAIPAYTGLVYSSSTNMLNGNFASDKKPMPLAFCYQIGSAINYRLNKNFCLLADANYFNGKANYNDNRIPAFPSPGPDIPYKVKFGLSSVNVTVGARVKF